MEKKIVYNIVWYTLGGRFIDSTQVDELDEELIWDLFKEFGHDKEKLKAYYKYTTSVEEID